jgi:ATP-binding cassette subfamily B (MDR/TAP) protein 1
MIERFYDPLSGNVELDGVDLKEINVKYLRSLIGYVGQEPTLFATTIAGNIKYGNLDATQEQIEAAARMANAHDFILSFPDGYDTQVGDKGAQLSGGKSRFFLVVIW